MRKDGKIISRKVKIAKRVNFALDKKLIKSEKWKDGDNIIQVPMGYPRIMLFNESLNERLYTDDEKDIRGETEAERNKRYILEYCDAASSKSRERYKKIIKRYGKQNSPKKKRAMNKLNKGKFENEEEIKKYQKKISIPKRERED